MESTFIDSLLRAIQFDTITIAILLIGIPATTVFCLLMDRRNNKTKESAK